MRCLPDRLERIVLPAVLTSLSAWTALAAVTAPGFAEPTFTLSLTALNRSYSDVVPPLDPIHSGPLTVIPSVPRSTLEIRDHRVELTPVNSGIFDGVLDITIAGRGILAAELSVIGPATTLRDEVTLPPQTLRIPSRVQLAWSTEGLRITTLTLPAGIQVRVESALGQRLVSSCEAMSSLFPIGCDAVGNSLSRLTVPLAEPGATYLIPQELIDSDSKAALLQLLQSP